MKEKDCYNCKNAEVKSTETPCISCDPNTMDKWELVEPSSDPFALLKRCKPFIERECEELIHLIESKSINWSEKELGTLRSRKVKYDTLLSDIKKMEKEKS